MPATNFGMVNLRVQDGEMYEITYSRGGTPFWKQAFLHTESGLLTGFKFEPIVLPARDVPAYLPSPLRTELNALRDEVNRLRRGRKAVTVSDLYRELRTLLENGRGDAEVWTEGCDCDAPASAVVDEGANVMIRRVR